MRFTKLVRHAVPLILTLAIGCTVLLPQPSYAASRPWPGHPDRRIVVHTVRPGDTATGLAVRYHAWTAELVRLNRIRHGVLYVGERIRIPIVVSATRKAGPKKQHATTTHAVRKDVPRARVRQIITRTAHRNGVPAKLVLALAWEESGWQQRVVSSAHAIGVMQVLPSTGTWMSLYAGRRLHLRDVHDNVLTGVLLLKVLREHTSTDRRAIAGYYQGLSAVITGGIYPMSRPYVANVLAIRRSMRHGWMPA